MEDKKQEERYINGYNDGYLLSRFEPDLLKKINQSQIKGNAYFDGMADGSKAQARELFQENLQKSRAVQQQSHKPKLG